MSHFTSKQNNCSFTETSLLSEWQLQRPLNKYKNMTIQMLMRLSYVEFQPWNKQRCGLREVTDQSLLQTCTTCFPGTRECSLSSITLAQTNKDMYTNWGQTIHLAVWYAAQGSQKEQICRINKPCRWKQTEDDFCNKHLLAIPAVTAAAIWPSFHEFPLYTSIPASISVLPSFPHSSLAQVPRQMVHESRCSPPSLSHREKQRLDPKQTESAGGRPGDEGRS